VQCNALVPVIQGRGIIRDRGKNFRTFFIIKIIINKSQLKDIKLELMNNWKYLISTENMFVTVSNSNLFVTGLIMLPLNINIEA
jgi:hypothetical protein